MTAVSEMMRSLVMDLTQPVFLVEVVLKGTLILAVALISVQIWRRASAATRHLVLGLALSANIVLPVCVVWAPNWQAPVFPLVSAQWQRDLKVSALYRSNEAGAEAPRDTIGRNTDAVATDEVGNTAGNLLSPVSGEARPTAWSNIPWRTWLIVLWLLGAALVLIRLIIALLIVGRILAGAQPVTDQAAAVMARDCGRRVGVSQDIPLLISKRATIPFTWGWLRPCIILPRESRNWSVRKTEIVLLHEFAHIKRWDAFSTGIAQLAAIIYWFNPLLWLVRHILLNEKERASDDCVLRTGIRPSEYAGCLLEIARNARCRRWLPELQVAMAQRTSLEERIMAIVTGSRPRNSVQTSRLTAGLFASFLLIFSLAGVQIFAQDNDQPVTASSVSTVAETVSPAEMQAISTLLDEFYDALNRGDDYDEITRRFLSADYFDDHSLTLENWSVARSEQVRHNTIKNIRSAWGGDKTRQTGTVRIQGAVEIDPDNPAQVAYRSEVLSCRKTDREYMLTQKVNIDMGGLAGERRPLVTDLVHSIELVRENGELKIKRYGGGIDIQRMDVNNPYGPILIVLLEHDPQSIPVGPMLFKSIPRSVAPGNVNFIPLRAETNDS